MHPMTKSCLAVFFATFIVPYFVEKFAEKQPKYIPMPEKYKRA